MYVLTKWNVIATKLNFDPKGREIFRFSDQVIFLDSVVWQPQYPKRTWVKQYFLEKNEAVGPSLPLHDIWVRIKTTVYIHTVVSNVSRI